MRAGCKGAAGGQCGTSTSGRQSVQLCAIIAERRLVVHVRRRHTDYAAGVCYTHAVAHTSWAARPFAIMRRWSAAAAAAAAMATAANDNDDVCHY